MPARRLKRRRYAPSVRLAAISLFILAGACHANPDATPCGQGGDAPCDADAGLLCVEESANAPQTCESTISCLQPLGPSTGHYFVPETWALAEQACNDSQPPPTGNIFWLSATPCDGIVALSEFATAATPQTGLYAVDGGALVAVYQVEDLGPAACFEGDVTFSASCLQRLLNEQIICGGADAGPDSSSDAD
jgi:hypothetical protein